MSDDESDSLDVSRRQVIKALAASAVCPMMTGCEFADLKDGGGGTGVDESSFSIDDAGYGDLSDVGGTACHQHGDLDLLLVRIDPDRVAAFNRTCPHQNLDMGDCGGNPTPAEWDDDSEVIRCNWHGSEFDTEGNFIDGPDPEETPDITTWPVDFDPSTGTGTVFSE